jgi:hypothetical protein
MRTGLAPFAAVVLISLVVLFAALAWTGRRAGLPVVGLAIGLVTYAVGSAVLQGALPIGRNPDPVDAMVDTVGIAVRLIAAGWSGPHRWNPRTTPRRGWPTSSGAPRPPPRQRAPKRARGKASDPP